MESTSTVRSDYMHLYRFLPVMDGLQIWKLRKIATGVLHIDQFSDEEISILETRLELDSLNNKLH